MKKDSKKEKKERKIIMWWNTIKELWSHPRYKAVIKLSFYFIFVGAILIFIQVMNVMNRNVKEVVYKTPLEIFQEQTTYHYQIKLEEMNPDPVVQEVLGEKDNLTNKFTIVGDINSYLIQDNQYYISSESGMTLIANPVSLDISKLTPILLSDMMTGGEEIANTTYKNGAKETTYEVSLQQFTKLYTGLQTNVSGNIIVKVKVEAEKITQITIDLTNYRKQQIPTILSSSVTLRFDS